MHVVVRDNNVEKAIKVLRRKLQREGVFSGMRLKAYYEKPSEKRVRREAETERRRRKAERKQAMREGLMTRGGRF